MIFFQVLIWMVLFSSVALMLFEHVYKLNQWSSAFWQKEQQEETQEMKPSFLYEENTVTGRGKLR